MAYPPVSSRATFQGLFPHITGCSALPASDDEGRLNPYDAKISPSRWIELSTCSCGSPGHWQRMMK